jgi:hypothetical protein
MVKHRFLANGRKYLTDGSELKDIGVRKLANPLRHYHIA